jgi:hypothetical protein
MLTVSEVLVYGCLWACGITVHLGRMYDGGGLFTSQKPGSKETEKSTRVPTSPSRAPSLSD